MRAPPMSWQNRWPRTSLFTKYVTFSEKLVEREHLATLHGGTSLTTTRVRRRYWIAKLRSLVKRVQKNCWGCRSNQAKPYRPPAPGPLYPPAERQETHPIPS